jgi:uncharacterized membrane protein YhaH (DUF805 family)
MKGNFSQTYASNEATSFTQNDRYYYPLSPMPDRCPHHRHTVSPPNPPNTPLSAQLVSTGTTAHSVQLQPTITTPHTRAEQDDLDAIDYFFKCMSSHYFNFSGRAQPKELWSFMLFASIIVFFISITDSIFGTQTLSTVINLAMISPCLAVGARRLHDIGLSGWWQLLYLTFFGILVLIIMWLLSSDKQSNMYGEPKLAPYHPIYSQK